MNKKNKKCSHVFYEEIAFTPIGNELSETLEYRLPFCEKCGEKNTWYDSGYPKGTNEEVREIYHNLAKKINETKQGYKVGKSIGKKNIVVKKSKIMKYNPRFSESPPAFLFAPFLVFMAPILKDMGVEKVYIISGLIAMLVIFVSLVLFYPKKGSKYTSYECFVLDWEDKG